ncbi:hypothetical protein KBC70_01985 [Candidatus Woesebacteria bacterium]|nr:hypothetical protein [Candidatus Woesebacteria bacterium]
MQKTNSISNKYVVVIVIGTSLVVYLAGQQCVYRVNSLIFGAVESNLNKALCNIQIIMNEPPEVNLASGEVPTYWSSHTVTASGTVSNATVSPARLSNPYY